MLYLILFIAGLGMLVLPISRILINNIQRKHPEKITDNRRQVYRIIAIIISFALIALAVAMTNLLKAGLNNSIPQ